MKKAFFIVFSISLLALFAPIQGVNETTYYASKVSTDDHHPIHPPVA